jgi:hypothetical protein
LEYRSTKVTENTHKIKYIYLKMYGHNRLLTTSYSPSSTVLSDDILDYPTIENGKFFNIIVNGTNIREGGGASIWKIPVSIVSDTNTALSGEYSGDPTTIGKRILLINQNAPVENGIYVVSATNWQRGVDLLDGDSAGGTFVLYTVSANNYYTYLCTNIPPNDIVGIDNIFFEQAKVGYPAGGINGQTQIYYTSLTPPSPFFNGDSKLVYSINDDDTTATLTTGGGLSTYIITNRLSGIPYILSSVKDLYFRVISNSALGGFNISGDDITINATDMLLNITDNVSSVDSEINIDVTGGITLTSPTDLIIYNNLDNTPTCTIGQNGISLANSSHTVAFNNTIVLTTYQGFITITGVTIVAGGKSFVPFDFPIYNPNFANIMSVKLINYVGTGDPYIKVYSSGPFFTVIIYNLNQSTAVNGDINFSYNIL